MHNLRPIFTHFRPWKKHPLTKSVKLACFSLIVLNLTACSTMTTKRSTTTAIMEERANVLTGSRLSNDTQSRLIQAGLEEGECLANMPNCIVQLKQAELNQQPDKGLYGAVAELFFASSRQRSQAINCQSAKRELATDVGKRYQSQQSEQQKTERSITQKTDNRIDCEMAKQDDLLQTVRFSYLYLMYDMLNQTTSNQANNTLVYLPKERDTQIQDLYYVAIDELGDSLYEKNLQDNYQITRNHIHVTFHGFDKEKRQNNTGKLISSYQINLTNLNSISRRDGFGINYVAVLDDRYTTSIRNQILNKNQHDLPASERIHPTGHLPVTALLLPQGDSIDEILTTTDFRFDLYDPYQTNRVTILGKPFALSANFSAPYGLWIKENSLEPLSIFNMLGSAYQNSQPQLFMLEPYNPNKQVILMLHGLASSPETWIRLTNDIFNDPTLRDNYQVWQLFYPTNIPILENRYQLHSLINNAFHQVDPEQDDLASQHAVLIGHSMGGVIGRLLVSNDDLTVNLKQMIENHIQKQELPSVYRNFERLNNDEQLELSKRLQLHALPQVDRAVFISAPFAGTDYADRWFTRGLRRIVSIPAGFVKTVTASLNALLSDAQLANNPLAGLFLENGASQLSDQSFFVKLTKSISIADNVAINTLIATDDRDLYDALKNDTLQNKLNNNDQIITNLPTDFNNNQSKQLNQSSQNSYLYNRANLNKAESLQAQRQQLLKQVSQGATERLSDGIVPYQSASLKDVESEKILSGKHNVHTSPQAVLELRRILHKQLTTVANTNPKHEDQQP
ncbi:esterase/lipase family protein [Faucicola boevrei]|uniref:esterase/lipase family protein n=1 Tax=Faucicola boevrei TaxID=346665 RepID=UPI0004768CB6|nr:alpha/beta hydrolase [Moraxella boevrei]